MVSWAMASWAMASWSPTSLIFIFPVKSPLGLRPVLVSPRPSSSVPALLIVSRPLAIQVPLTVIREVIVQGEEAGALGWGQTAFMSPGPVLYINSFYARTAFCARTVIATPFAQQTTLLSLGKLSQICFGTSRLRILSSERVSVIRSFRSTKLPKSLQVQFHKNYFMDYVFIFLHRFFSQWTN